MALLRTRAQRNHSYTAENLSAYLDDALSRQERERVERHLSACADCRDDLSTLRQTVHLLRKAPVRPAPRSFALPLSVQPEQTAYRRWNNAYGYMRAASVVVSLLLVLTFSGDALLGRWLGPAGGQRDMAMEPQAESAAAPERVKEEPMRAMAPMAAPAEIQVELAQPSPVQIMGTVVVEKEVALAPKLAPAMGGGGEASARGDVSPALSVPKPSGVGPVTGVASERRVAAVATSVALATAPLAEAPLPVQALPTTLLPSPTFYTAMPQQKAARVVTLAPQATPEPMRVMKEAPAFERLPAEPQADAYAPGSAVSGPGWRTWGALRVLSGVLIGLLLILVAGLVWIAPKRRA